MKKINVEVFMPGTNKYYDICVSPELTIKIAAEYIHKTICEYEELEGDNISTLLCSVNQKRILAGELTLKEAEIKDGSRLILI